MIQILYIILLTFAVTNCSFNKVIKHHGVPFLEKKQTQSDIKNLGKMKIYKNDVLVLEIDSYGLLKKKDFYNKEDMQNIQIVKATTQSGFKKNTFIYDFFSSMRQKVNDPLGVRAKKRKEISQR